MNKSSSDKLYEYLRDNQFSDFTSLYEALPAGTYYADHVKWLATAYRDTPYSDKKYQEFIYYLLNKENNIQILSLLVAQGENITFYLDKMNYRHCLYGIKITAKSDVPSSTNISSPNNLFDPDGPLIKAAIRYDNRKFLLFMIKYMGFETIFKEVFATGQQNLKDFFITIAPQNEKLAKMIISDYLKLIPFSKNDFTSSVEYFKDCDAGPIFEAYRQKLATKDSDMKIFIQNFALQHQLGYSIINKKEKWLYEMFAPSYFHKISHAAKKISSISGANNFFWTDPDENCSDEMVEKFYFQIQLTKLPQKEKQSRIKI